MEVKLSNILSRVLGAIYLLAGGSKLVSPSKAVMLKDFVQYTTVFPLKSVGLVPTPETYMLAVGIAETGLATGLLVGSRRVRQACSVGLIIFMVGAAETLYLLEWWRQFPVPCGFLVALFFNFYKLSQDSHRTKKDSFSQSKQK